MDVKRALGYQRITPTASTALTVPDGTSLALITTETQNIRIRDDGTAPTSSVGFPIVVGQVLSYTGSFSALRMIETTSGAVVNVLYYGN